MNDLTKNTVAVCHRGKLALCALIMALAPGCGDGRPHVTVPPFDPPKSAQRAVEELDQDGDGAISADETAGCPPLGIALKDIDANGDGQLAPEEIEARIRGYTESKIGLQSVSCKVIANGRPLEGAMVVFKPVTFLEDALKPAQCKTGPGGWGPVMMSESGLPGLAPGIYRVEISKKSGERELIPDQYNTESELGYELSPQDPPRPAEFRISIR